MTIVDATYCMTDAMPLWSDNPLVAALGPYRGLEELRRDLYHNPYANRDFTLMPQHLRDAAIDELASSAFAVSTRELEFATLMQRMLWSGLARRNPRRPEVMASLTVFSTQCGRNIESLPWSSEWASAAKVSGITGTGKSHISKRVLSLWPQVIRHGWIEGVWNGWLQMNWLYLDMSFDGNLNGLLLHMLREVDLAFEGRTNYAEIYPAISRNRQQLQVWVIDVLKRHFCGLVVLDEMQAVSLLLGQDSKLVANFFLRLLNQGIPMILEGNPFAFDLFRSVSQLWDRINSEVFPDMLPDGFDDADSREFILPQLWQMQVMPEIAPLTAPMVQAIYDCSAWHRRYMVWAMQHAQRIATARDCARLEVEHVVDGFRLLVDPRIQQRIRAFAHQRPHDLLEWDDIPVLALTERWGIGDQTIISQAEDHDIKIRIGQHCTSSGAPDSRKISRAKHTVTASEALARERAKTKARITRKITKQRANHAVVSADPEDLRKQGIQSALIKNFEELPSATPTETSPMMTFEELSISRR